MKDIWLWPKNTINSSNVIDNKNLLSTIEKYFSNLYSPFSVVYFSRARVALNAILSIENCSRPQLTFCQPFSSHCVLSNIAKTSTPATNQVEKTAQQIIYHQWGLETKVDSNKYNNILIEDSVDSLILTNNKNTLFPNNAPYCLISLPKIIKASIGSIVICQKVEDQQKLINYRDSSSQPIKKELIDTAYLQESLLKTQATLVPKINNIDKLIEQSKTQISHNIKKIKNSFPYLYENILNITISKERLPSNLIFSAPQRPYINIYENIPFNIIEKNRTFFNYNTEQCQRVSLIPCHYQANW